MAKIYLFRSDKDTDGKKRTNEPLPRPFVRLNDGTTMPYKEWYDKGEPN